MHCNRALPEVNHVVIGTFTADNRSHSRGCMTIQMALPLLGPGVT